MKTQDQNKKLFYGSLWRAERMVWMSPNEGSAVIDLDEEAKKQKPESSEKPVEAEKPKEDPRTQRQIDDETRKLQRDLHTLDFDQYGVDEAVTDQLNDRISRFMNVAEFDVWGTPDFDFFCNSLEKRAFFAKELGIEPADEKKIVRKIAENLFLAVGVDPKTDDSSKIAEACSKFKKLKIEKGYWYSESDGGYKVETPVLPGTPMYKMGPKKQGEVSYDHEKVEYGDDIAERLEKVNFKIIKTLQYRKVEDIYADVEKQLQEQINTQNLGITYENQSLAVAVVEKLRVKIAETYPKVNEDDQAFVEAMRHVQYYGVKEGNWYVKYKKNEPQDTDLGAMTPEQEVFRKKPEVIARTEETLRQVQAGLDEKKQAKEKTKKEDEKPAPAYYQETQTYLEKIVGKGKVEPRYLSTFEEASKIELYPDKTFDVNIPFNGVQMECTVHRTAEGQIVLNYNPENDQPGEARFNNFDHFVSDLNSGEFLKKVQVLNLNNKAVIEKAGVTEIYRDCKNIKVAAHGEINLTVERNNIGLKPGENTYDLHAGDLNDLFRKLRRLDQFMKAKAELTGRGEAMSVHYDLAGRADRDQGRSRRQEKLGGAIEVEQRTLEGLEQREARERYYDNFERNIGRYTGEKVQIGKIETVKGLRTEIKGRIYTEIKLDWLTRTNPGESIVLVESQKPGDKKLRAYYRQSKVALYAGDSMEDAVTAISKQRESSDQSGDIDERRSKINEQLASRKFKLNDKTRVVAEVNGVVALTHEEEGFSGKMVISRYDFTNPDDISRALGDGYLALVESGEVEKKRGSEISENPTGQELIDRYGFHLGESETQTEFSTRIPEVQYADRANRDEQIALVTNPEDTAEIPAIKDNLIRNYVDVYLKFLITHREDVTDIQSDIITNLCSLAGITEGKVKGDTFEKKLASIIAEINKPEKGKRIRSQIEGTQYDFVLRSPKGGGEQMFERRKGEILKHPVLSIHLLSVLDELDELSAGDLPQVERYNFRDEYLREYLRVAEKVIKENQDSIKEGNYEIAINLIDQATLDPIQYRRVWLAHAKPGEKMEKVEYVENIPTDLDQPQQQTAESPATGSQPKTAEVSVSGREGAEEQPKALETLTGKSLAKMVPLVEEYDRMHFDIRKNKVEIKRLTELANTLRKEKKSERRDLLIERITREIDALQKLVADKLAQIEPVQKQYRLASRALRMFRSSEGRILYSAKLAKAAFDVNSDRISINFIKLNDENTGKPYMLTITDDGDYIFYGGHDNFSDQNENEAQNKNIQICTVRYNDQGETYSKEQMKAFEAGRVTVLARPASSFTDRSSRIMQVFDRERQKPEEKKS
jgi:hypothetical protein